MDCEQHAWSGHGDFLCPLSLHVCVCVCGPCMLPASLMLEACLPCCFNDVSSRHYKVCMEETTKNTVETKVHQDGGADLSLPKLGSQGVVGEQKSHHEAFLTLLQLDSLLQSDIHSHDSHVWLAALALQYPPTTPWDPSLPAHTQCSSAVA